MAASGSELRKFSNPTRYSGVMFRSRLEATYAKWFDKIGIAWSYEPEGYMLGNGHGYLPDFWLPDQGAWFECKGVMLPVDEAKIVQLAIESGCDVFVGTTIRGGDLRIGAVDMYNDGGHEVGYATMIAAKCGKCNRVWLMQDWGNWECRCCGYYCGNAGFDELDVIRP